MLGWHANEIKSPCVIWRHVIWSLSRLKLKNWHRCIHSYISYTISLTLLSLTPSWTLRTLSTASYINHIVNIAFQFCHSSPTCSWEDITTEDLHGIVKERNVYLHLYLCPSFGESAWIHTKQLYPYYIGTCTTIIKIISNLFFPQLYFFFQSLVLNKVGFWFFFPGNVKIFTIMTSTQPQ